MNTVTDKKSFEETCEIFIKSVNEYFTHLTQTPSRTGVPYLKAPKSIIMKDFTGMIGISGSHKGFIYISGDRPLYVELIKNFLGLISPSKDDILDMAGELTNVIAGNMRTTYGSNFMISVPIVFEGRPKQMKFPNDVSVYVIPILWGEHEANLVIGLE